MVYMYILLSALGLTFGSFVNAFVWRLHKQARKKDKQYSIVTGRSMCTHCKHELAAKDLIPVVSWVWLRGRCRYCRKPIEDTPLPELVLPLLFVLSYLAWPFGFALGGQMLFVLWLVILVLFLSLALYDLRWFLLPNRLVLPVTLLSALYFVGRVAAGGRPAHMAFGLLAALLLLPGLFWLLFTVSRGTWIGGGDVKLAVALALLVGSAFGAAVVLFVASLAGTVAALPQVLRGKAGLRTKLPFGPLLILGTIIGVLFQKDMLNALMRLYGL